LKANHFDAVSDYRRFASESKTRNEGNINPIIELAAALKLLLSAAFEVVISSDLKMGVHYYY